MPLLSHLYHFYKELSGENKLMKVKSTSEIVSWYKRFCVAIWTPLWFTVNKNPQTNKQQQNLIAVQQLSTSLRILDFRGKWYYSLHLCLSIFYNKFPAVEICACGSIWSDFGWSMNEPFKWCAYFRGKKDTKSLMWKILAFSNMSLAQNLWL